MSQKQKKNVPDAEVPKQTEPAQTKNSQVQSVPVVSEEIPKSSIDLFNEIMASVNPKDLEKAEALGFPIKKMILLMGTMTTEIQQIAITIPNVIKNKMNEVIKEAQEQQKTRIQLNPQMETGGGKLSQTAEVIQIIKNLGLGDSSDELGLSGILKEAVVAGIKEDLAFSRVVKRKFMEKLGVDIVAEAIKSTEVTK